VSEEERKRKIDFRDNSPIRFVVHCSLTRSMPLCCVSTGNGAATAQNLKYSQANHSSITGSQFLIQTGKSAYLSCRVRNLSNKTVSWIRHRDIHILTVGSYTYTSDQRFQATHHKENDEWTLQIKWAQKRDGGGEF
jgi:hypothetical protein